MKQPMVQVPATLLTKLFRVMRDNGCRYSREFDANDIAMLNIAELRATRKGHCK